VVRVKKSNIYFNSINGFWTMVLVTYGFGSGNIMPVDYMVFGPW
jgi:hypothetical protein